jgi:hypothetical protein
VDRRRERRFRDHVVVDGIQKVQLRHFHAGRHFLIDPRAFGL